MARASRFHPTRNAQSLIAVLLLLSSAFASISAQNFPDGEWQTLSGNAPLVIARGGFSGLFPDSSRSAYEFTNETSLPNAISWCDVQLTKDGVGICFPSIKLENASDIGNIFPDKSRTYFVNGKSTQGWFSIDFTHRDLMDVTLMQGIYSRSDGFDQDSFPILTVLDMAKTVKSSQIWLNIQHDLFFTQHNLSMKSFVISLSRSVRFDYISSPEVNFLKSIQGRLRRNSTKLVFRFLGLDEVEPSTNKTYASLLKNLNFIKKFVSGILVPKTYIWPVDKSLYLEPHTSLVLDAHKEGLEIFASDFSNDVPYAYNYSYDPVAEYLSFMDYGNFSVDGVLSDFPITPSAAIDCFAHMGENIVVKSDFMIISYEGASGDYPGCTDLAYTRAISSDADVLDCPVQLTKDGVPFCLGSINLMDRTTVVQSSFSNLTTNIPELGIGDGIFTFNLNWSEIQKLRPAILNPYPDFTLYRNPKFRNAGKIVPLSDFLILAKHSPSVSGILLSIEHAAYLAEHQGLDIIDTVLKSLKDAGYNDQMMKKAMIQSTDSSVLKKFKEKCNHELVYKVKENIRDVQNSTIMEIKEFADSVVISKESIYPIDKSFLTSTNNVVQNLQAWNLLVFVQLFSNEFPSQAWDFFSDPYVQINSYVYGIGINGLITDFPATATRYKRNRCMAYTDTPLYMSSVEPGQLLQLVAAKPPAKAPYPVLLDGDVVEPPLPDVAPVTKHGSPDPSPTHRNWQPSFMPSIYLCSVALILIAIMLF